MLVVGSLPKRRRQLGIMLGMMVIGMTVTSVGCGRSSHRTTTTTTAGTPAANYTVTVTAKGTAGSYGGDTSDHAMTVTLTVQ